MRSRLLVSMTLSSSLVLVAAIGLVVKAQDRAPESQGPARLSAKVGAGEYDEQTGDSVAVVEASDPRLSGSWTESTGLSTAVRMEGGPDGVVSIWLHAITIDNAGGRWTGHSEGFGHSEDFRTDVTQDADTVYLVGHDAYEGLTATLFAPEGEDRGPSGIEGGSYEGVIFPTGWQPIAEPSTAP